MNRFLVLAGVLFAASLAGGCLQTLPDGSVAAAPQTAALMGAPARRFFEGEGPPPNTVVQYDVSGRPVAADPDIHIRAALRRDRCQSVVIEHSCADAGGGGGGD